MPRKKKSDVSQTQSTAERRIPKELLDQMVKGPITQGEFETIYRTLKKAIIVGKSAARYARTKNCHHRRGIVNRPVSISATVTA